MKKFVILALVVFLATSNDLLAQEFEGTGVEIEVSDPIDSRRNSVAYFIQGDDGQVFSRNTIKKKPYLVRYAEDLSEREKLLLTPDIVPKRSYIEKIVNFNGALVLFYSTLDKRTNSNSLYYVILSQEDLSTLQSAEKVFSMTITSKRNSGSFNVTMSRDSSKLLVFASTPFKRSKNAKDEVKVLIMDKDFSVVWDDKITLPYTDRDFGIMDYDVDNQGNVFVLGRLKIDKSKRSRREQSSTFKVLTYMDEGATFEEHDLGLKNKFISEIDYYIKSNGNLMCSGLYSDESESQAAGAFYLELESGTFDVVSENLVEFDLDFLTEGMSDKQEAKTRKRAAKGKSVELVEYDVRNLIDKEDGGLIMVAEQFYIRVTSYTDANGRTTYTYHYYYNDIIVVSFDDDGEIEWSEKIPKYQYTINDNGYKSGFNLVAYDDKLHFFFVENGANVKDLDFDKRSDRDDYRANHFVHATIDLDGSKMVESMGTIEKRDFTPIPKKFRTSRNGFTTIILEGRKEHKIGKISVE